jgi:hypothetical protein
VLNKGGRVTIDGLSISVSRDGNHGYNVRIEGEYRPTDPFIHTSPHRLNPTWHQVQLSKEDVSVVLFGATVGAVLSLIFNRLRIRQRGLPCSP